MTGRDGKVVISVREKSHLRFPFFENVALGIEQAKTPDRVQVQLPFKDRACFIFIAAADRGPAQSREAGFLNLVFADHGSPPARRLARFAVGVSPCGFCSGEAGAFLVREKAKPVPHVFFLANHAKTQHFLHF
jgi:hypothetical protein